MDNGPERSAKLRGPRLVERRMQVTPDPGQRVCKPCPEGEAPQRGEPTLEMVLEHRSFARFGKMPRPDPHGSRVPRALEQGICCRAIDLPELPDLPIAGERRELIGVEALLRSRNVENVA